CFPGGGIQLGETEQEAVIREIAEEIGVACSPRRKIWQSRTTWGTNVAWWGAQIEANVRFQLNAAEVAELLWLSPAELIDREDLLPSNYDFLVTWKAAKIRIDNLDPYHADRG
ncbi:MAG: NUDIX domain-containing protein, partial [Blastopirellula sp. JB062]